MSSQPFVLPEKGSGKKMKRQEQLMIQKTERYVRKELENEASGHDWWHIHRVRNLALTIAAHEKEPTIDPFVCEMSALLHDIPDEKLNESLETGERKVRNWLEELKLEKRKGDEILAIVLHLSYKGGTNKVELQTIEGKIVQDADRLDAIGAIGIARTMAYSGAHGRLIHDPNKKPREEMTLEEYRSGNDTAIIHFYEKLLKLKDTIHTNYGKKIAADRHRYMELFLEEFYQEWDGKK